MLNILVQRKTTNKLQKHLLKIHKVPEMKQRMFICFEQK